MATDNPVSHKFNWGDSVRVLKGAPSIYRQFEVGSICGIRLIETEENSRQLQQPIGTVLYLVEGGDGESLEVPEQYLEAI